MHQVGENKMKDEPEDRPTPEQIRKIMVESCLKAFHDYKTNWNLVDFGGSKFTFLKSIGLINLTPERYAEIMEQAKQQVLAESTATVFKSGEDSTAGVIAKAIIQAPDKHEVTKNAARLIALKEYFDYLIEFEMELTDLINS